MNLVKMLTDQLSGDSLGKLSSLLGTSPGQTQKAASAAVPSILAGLAGMASSNDGAQKLAGTLGKLDTGMVGNLMNMLGGSANQVQEQGGSLLNSILGGSITSGIASAVAKFSGIDAGIVKTLLGYLTPFIMGTVAKQFGGRPVTPQGLTSLFAEQKANIASAIPSGFTLGDIPGLGSALGAAKNVAGAATGAAQEAGSAASRWLLPVLGILLLLALVYWFFLRPKPEANLASTATSRATTRITTPTMPAAPNATEITQFGTELTSVYSSLTTALTGVTDAASADAALPKLKEQVTKLDTMKSVWDRIPASARGSITKIATDNLGKLKDLIAKVLALPVVGEKLKPVLDELTTKLTALSA